MMRKKAIMISWQFMIGLVIAVMVFAPLVSKGASTFSIFSNKRAEDMKSMESTIDFVLKNKENIISSEVTLRLDDRSVFFVIDAGKQQLTLSAPMTEFKDAAYYTIKRPESYCKLSDTCMCLCSEYAIDGQNVMCNGRKLECRSYADLKFRIPPDTRTLFGEKGSEDYKYEDGFAIGRGLGMPEIGFKTDVKVQRTGSGEAALCVKKELCYTAG